MPTYEYRCDSCNHEWEADQRITEEPHRKCIHCGEDTAKRLISRTGFTLTGGGWAKDRYSSSRPPRP